MNGKMAKFIMMMSVLSSLNFSLASECRDGFSSSWMYDQEKGSISIESTTKMEVCHFIKKQMSANVEIQFLKNESVVFTNEIFWSNAVRIEEMSKYKNQGQFKKIKDYKILKFPIQLSKIDSYRVISKESGKKIGEGKIK